MTNEYQVTPQKPIPSGFGWHTTATEILRGRDLNGKIAIVTGGHSGIGVETTRALAKAGARVIVGARSQEKAQAAISDLTCVEAQELDLIDPDSIDRASGKTQPWPEFYADLILTGNL